MGRSVFESVAVFVVFVVIYFLADSLNLRRFQRRYEQGQAPVIRSQRLPFRFSLRALLIAMTLTAVLMTLAVFVFR